MNTELLALLINQAKQNKMIAYGQIMMQFGFDRYQLHRELELVARNEHEGKRPMLTVMAHYKTGGYGKEFFKLAEEFGYGDHSKLQHSDFARTMRVKCFQYWFNVSGSNQKAYYLLGSKYGEAADISMLDEMVDNSCVSVGFYYKNLSDYYGKPEEDIKQFLLSEGEEPKSYNALKKFLQLKPGDVVAIKKSGSPKGSIPSLIIDAYAIVVSRNDIIYFHDAEGDLGHCINVEFIDTNLNREFSVGGYNSTIARITDVERISQLFNGALSKDEEIVRSKIRKRRDSVRKTTTSQNRNGSIPYVANLKHNNIQNCFSEYLKEKYGADKVKLEEDWVDIKLDLGDRVIFYEVKPYQLVEDCIREGLGQILLYSFFSDESRKKKLVIIGPSIPSSNDQELIEYIKSNTSFDFDYEGFSME